MQKVELYHGPVSAKLEMEKEIKAGWRIHTCSMSNTQSSGYGYYERVLVVYERDDEAEE